MFLLLFSIILFVTNFICFFKKKYLYLFIPCALFLPEFYGFDLNESLPIISVSRIMYLIFYLYAFLNRRRSISFKDLLSSIKKEYILLFGYFLFRIVSNLYYVTTYGQALKTILLLIFEQLLLFIGIYLLAPTKEEIIKLMEVTTYTASALFIVGLFESFTYLRPFDYLYTVSRYVLNDYYIRLGLLRSTAGMGLPGFFGNMCMLILAFALFLYNYKPSKRYLVIIALDILATIHSGSRSNMIFSLVVIAFYFTLIKKNKQRYATLLKNSLIVILLCATFIGTLSVSNSKYRYFYVTTAKSVLNEVGFNFDLNEGKPKHSEGFGNNSNGTYSRTSQLTGISYALTVNPLFGQGSGVQNRSEVMYYFHDMWLDFNTIDMGIVEIFVTEGIFGFLGYLSIIAFIIYRLIRSKILTFRFSAERIFFLVFGFAYLLSTLSTVNMQNFLILYVIIVICFTKDLDMYH